MFPVFRRMESGDELVDAERKVPDPDTRCVEHGVGDGGGRSDDAISPIPLTPIGLTSRSFSASQPTSISPTSA